jgi:hypothetical protein
MTTSSSVLQTFTLARTAISRSSVIDSKGTEADTSTPPPVLGVISSTISTSQPFEPEKE